MSKKEKTAWNKKVEKLTKDTATLETEIEEIKNNKIYENAFEWRFEFPEVLNDEGDFVGFDTVIGNPPYIRQEELKEFKPHFENKFKTYAGTADLFVYFVELGMNNLTKNGDFTFIIPNKWMRAGYGKALRNFIKEYRIQSILDFGDLPVFEEATTYPNILSLSKNDSEDIFNAVNLDTLDFSVDLKTHVEQNKMSVLVSELSEGGWTLTDAEIQLLLKKIKSKGISLSEYVNGKVYYGIKTGLNDAFVIDEKTRKQLITKDKRSAEIIKPFLAGRDIKRYQQPQCDKHLILFKKGETKDKYGDLTEHEAWDKLSGEFPSLCKHLKPYEEKAKKRSDKGDYWWELRACDYYPEFEKNKIMLPDISIKCEALYDSNNYYCVNTAYVIPEMTYSDLGILNSKLILFFYSNLTQTIRGGYFRFIRQYLEKIPIVKTDVLTPKVNHIITLKKENPEADTTALEEEIDQLVYALYGLTNSKIKSSLSSDMLI